MLPRPPEPFYCRQELLKLMSEWLGASPLLILKGLAGIGKTAVVLHFLEKRGQSDSHYVRLLPGMGLQPVFEELDSDSQSADPRVQVLDLVKQLNSRGGCWVLEDLHLLEPGLATQLLRSLQAYVRFPVVVTTREELPLSPVEQVEFTQVKLEPLDPSGSLELLDVLLSRRGLADQSRDSLCEALKPVGGHPYLIKLLAAAWNENRSAVGEVLVSEIVAGLSPEATQLLHRLSLSQVPLSQQALEGFPGAAELNVLSQKFLVEKGPDGYWVPRLIADYLAQVRDQAETLRFHRDLARVHQTEAALYHGLAGQDYEFVMVLLERECAQLISRGRYQLLQDCLPQLEKAGLQLPPRVLQTKSHVLSNLGRWEDSLRCLDLLQKVPGYELEARLSRAGTLLNQGEWESALREYSAILAEPDLSPEVRTKAAHYSILLHAYRGETEQARQLLERHPLPESWSPAHRLRIESVLCHFEQRPERSLELAQQALAGSRQLQAGRLSALCQQALAEALCDTSQYQAAADPLRESLDWARRAGDAQVLGFSLLSLGRLHHELGQDVPARQAWEESELAFISQGNRNGAAMARLGLLRLEKSRGGGDDKNWQRCFKAAEECGNPPLKADLLAIQATPAPASPPRPAAPVLAPASTESGLKVRLFGDLLVSGPLGELTERDWPTRKAAGLFGLLCYGGGKGYSDQLLVSHFWPDSSEERARSSLRSALHQVRTSLARVAGEELAQGLSRSRKVGTVHLDMPIEVDNHELKRLLKSGENHYLAKKYAEAIGELQQAQDLYRGDFLEKFRDEWTDVPRQSCREDAMRVCQMLCLSYLESKQGEEAEAAARRGLILDDLSEELHCGLMEALLLQGLRAEALRHYRKTLHYFEQELSLYPRSFDSIFERLVV
ncbi:MAG: BTAD domain-containing putative transcriptional regulator [Vulcanimicrobiota bacterium]